MASTSSPVATSASSPKGRLLASTAIVAPADNLPQRRNRLRAPADPMAFAFTLADAQAMGAPGRTKIYELFKSGKLRKVNVAGRTMVDGNSLRALLTAA